MASCSASKFGVEGFAETLREEVKDKGIKITVVRTGVTDTAFFSKAGMDVFHKMIKSGGKIHSPHSVVKVILSEIKDLPDEITIGTDKLFLAILPV